MVGDHTEGNISFLAFPIMLPSDLGYLIGDIPHGIHVKQGTYPLHHASQAFQPHAGIDILLL